MAIVVSILMEAIFVNAVKDSLISMNSSSVSRISINSIKSLKFDEPSKSTVLILMNAKMKSMIVLIHLNVSILWEVTTADAKMGWNRTD